MRNTAALVLLAVAAWCLALPAPAAAGVTLSAGYVNPPMGGTSTLFSFWVTYKDSGGAAPTAALVFIDGVGPYTMTFVDGDYLSGARFRRQAYLKPGTHNFRFYFASSSGSATWPNVGTCEGPNVSALYDVTDYFPLTGSWSYHTNHGTDAVGIETRTAMGGSPVTFDCNFTADDGSVSDDWEEYWSSSASGVYWHGMTDDGFTISLDPPFRVPNGVYVGQTATTAHAVTITGIPYPLEGWCTYRIDGVERISVPWGTANCLKLTVSIDFPNTSVHLQWWLAKGVGQVQGVGIDHGESVVERLVARSP